MESSDKPQQKQADGNVNTSDKPQQKQADGNVNPSGTDSQNAGGFISHCEIDHKFCPGLRIADPRCVFRGLTYGQWVAVWLNQLMSDQPDVQYSGRGKGMVFLRGNIEFAYTQDPAHPFLDMTVENRLRIFEDTAIVVPVMTTMFNLGETYQGQIMNDEISMRNTGRRDTVDGGAIGATITVPTNLKDPYPLVDNLDDFYVESPLFPLSVAENNAYKKTGDSYIEAGPYQSLTVGVFVIISHWPVGLFRLTVFGRGVGSYLSRSVYDIEVTSGSIKLSDISDISKNTTIAGLSKPQDDMNFTPKWEKKSS